MDDTYEIYEKYRQTQITIEELYAFQLNISNECRWFLLGKLCFDETAKNIELTRPDIFNKLRPTFGLSDGTYRRFMAFKLAIDRLHELVPELMPRIIEGKARLSIENSITASRWEADIIREALEKLRDRAVRINSVFAEHPSHRKEVRTHIHGTAHKSKQSVKDTPVYDPEAQISGICYTIPSWVTAIDRAFTATEFANISPNTRYTFTKELTVLKETAQVVLDMLRGE